jgi:CHAT domain-containing protein
MNNCEQVVIAPDGALNDVSFAALAYDGPTGWLGDGLIFSYVNSARDLTTAKAMHPTERQSGPLVLADPAYPLDSRWSRLDGSRFEGEMIARRLGCPLHSFTSATPKCLRGAGSPRVLHIAAHGFYLPHLPQASAGLPPEICDIASKADPLARAGVALAPDRREDGTAIDDGVVTAREMLAFDFAYTELAVLSACESGLGHPEPLDGAHGLRRALRAAGVSTVVVSLWKVGDKTTADLMGRFYEHLTAEPPHRALALAARELSSIRATRHPSHWAAFIVFGQHGRPLG